MLTGGARANNGRDMCRRQAPSFTPRNGEQWKLCASANDCRLSIWPLEVQAPTALPRTTTFWPFSTTTQPDNMRFTAIPSLLLLAAGAAQAASSWSFDDASVSISSKKGVGEAHKET